MLSFKYFELIAKLLWKAVSEWLKDEASFLAAALAYFGVFSLVPLFIVVTILLNSFFSINIFGSEIVDQAQNLAANQAPKAASEIIDRAGDQAASASFTVLSILTMLMGSAGLFVQIKRSFKIIWKLPDEDTPLLDTIASYLVSFLLIGTVALMLLATSLVTAFIIPIARQIEDLLPIHLGLLRIITLSISFVFVTALFAVTYKTLSGIKLDWKDVIFGSALASLLFVVGNFVIETYVSIVNLGSAYGAAGSLVVLLFWIYYSAQIFLFGAEFVKVQKRWRP
ncbi:MAG: YihY/virulence factor BrkB family protein [Methanothrix sp.]